MIDESEKLFKVKCKNDFCFIQLDNINYEFPSIFLQFILKDIESNKAQMYPSKTFMTFYILANENYFNFIIKSNHKGKSNEKTENDTNLFSIAK